MVSIKLRSIALDFYAPERRFRVHRASWRRGRMAARWSIVQLLFRLCASPACLRPVAFPFRFELKNTRHNEIGKLVLVKYEHVVLKCRSRREKHDSYRSKQFNQCIHCDCWRFNYKQSVAAGEGWCLRETRIDFCRRCTWFWCGVWVSTASAMTEE